MILQGNWWLVAQPDFRKKILGPSYTFCPIFWESKFQQSQKKLFLLFFYELSHSDSKNAIKNFWLDFSPLWGHVTWDLEFFWKISKFSIFFFVYFFELSHSESKKTKKIFLSIMRSGHLRLRIFLILFKFFDFFVFRFFFEISLLLIRIESKRFK